jgi:prevent-host-death family protein
MSRHDYPRIAPALHRHRHIAKLTNLVILAQNRQMAKKRALVNIAAAKARLPELVERAANGEEIVLARNGKPKARLVPFEARKPFLRGAGRGKWKGVDRVLQQPLPADLLAAFYGESALSDAESE